MTLKLVVTTNVNGDVFELLLKNARYGVGRRSDNDLRIKETYISGYHAELVRTESGHYLLGDLGSSNGTRVNGAEVEEAKLKDGDRIGFGDVQAVFYAGEPPAMDAIKAAAPPPPKALPVPDVLPSEPPAPVKLPASKARLSPVRRAYSRSIPSSYPDTASSGCMTGAIVVGLFVAAFVVGLSLRHVKEMDGNFVTDFIEKLTDKMPKVKIEKKADE